MTALKKEVPEAAAVLTHALLRTAEKLGLSQAQVARVVGIDATKVSRMAKGAAFLRAGAGEWDAAAAVIRVYRSLAGLLDGNELLMAKWFTSFNHDFAKTPREAMLESGGAYRLVNYLDALRGRF